jgi:hypothetical protein
MVHLHGVSDEMKLKNAVFWDVTPCASCKNGITTQKTDFFIATAMKTSNLPKKQRFLAMLKELHVLQMDSTKIKDFRELQEGSAFQFTIRTETTGCVDSNSDL